MATLDKILSLEARNRNYIYLYEHGDKWFAYERSAYHFTQVFKMGEIIRTGGVICVILSDQLEFLHSRAMSLVKITSLDDRDIKIDCATPFTGFDQWKQKQLI